LSVTIIALIYAIAGTLLFILALKIFSVEHNILHAAISCILAGVTVAVVPGGGGIASLIVMVIVYKVLSRQEVTEFILPVFVSRLGLVPVLLYFKLSVI